MNTYQSPLATVATGIPAVLPALIGTRAQLSAAQTITRLLEIGIPSYLVNATPTGVLAQRLARRNCSHCRKLQPVSADIQEPPTMSLAQRELIHAQVSHDQVEAQTVTDGMTRLSTQALTLARAGTISLEEVLRVRID